VFGSTWLVGSLAEQELVLEDTFVRMLLFDGSGLTFAGNSRIARQCLAVWCRPGSNDALRVSVGVPLGGGMHVDTRVATSVVHVRNWRSVE
jgi:hypothetical protein